MHMVCSVNGLILGLAAVAQGKDGDRVIKVEKKPGSSIQAAIDRARPGDTISVGSGTYAEQLLITKDRISLVGNSAILTPPPSFSANACTDEYGPGTQAGICVAGSGIQVDNFIIEHKKVTSVQRFVRGVSITGFQVKGFHGAGIGIIGADDTTISANTLLDGDVYGALTAGSKNTIFSANTVRQAGNGTQGIGICTDNFSDVRVERNTVDSYGVGLCVQTDGAIVKTNMVTNSCFGIFVDPFVDRARINDNTVTNGSFACAAGAGFGVWLDGVTNTQVKKNVFGGLAINVAVQDAYCQFQPGLSCAFHNGTNSLSKGNIIEA